MSGVEERASRSWCHKSRLIAGQSFYTTHSQAHQRVLCWRLHILAVPSEGRGCDWNNAAFPCYLPSLVPSRHIRGSMFLKLLSLGKIPPVHFPLNLPPPRRSSRGPFWSLHSQVGGQHSSNSKARGRYSEGLSPRVLSGQHWSCLPNVSVETQITMRELSWSWQGLHKLIFYFLPAGYLAVEWGAVSLRRVSRAEVGPWEAAMGGWGWLFHGISVCHTVFE